VANEDAFVIIREGIPVAAICDGAGAAEQVAKRVLRLFELWVREATLGQILDPKLGEKTRLGPAWWIAEHVSGGHGLRESSSGSPQSVSGGPVGGIEADQGLGVIQDMKMAE